MRKNKKNSEKSKIKDFIQYKILKIQKTSILYFFIGSILFCSSVYLLSLSFSKNQKEQDVKVHKLRASTSSSPSPSKNVEANYKPKEIVQGQALNNPQPTTNPDPIVTCNSKTGALQVRSSVCRSNTDCPDGYGGYVFESQDACKARWNKISADLKNVIGQYTKAQLEQMNLMNQANQTTYQPPAQVTIPTPVQFNPQVSLTIKDIPSPSIAPQGQGSMYYKGY